MALEYTPDFLKYLPGYVRYGAESLGIPERSRLGQGLGSAADAVGGLAASPAADFAASLPQQQLGKAMGYLLEEPPPEPMQQSSGAYGGQVNTPGPVHPRAAELDLLEQEFNQKMAAQEASRSQELKQGGFTEYAPGVAYKMGSKPLMGPPEQRTAFGKTYTPTRGGGAASMMQSSGNMPGVRARELERRGQTLEDMNYQQQLQMASLNPQQVAGLKQRQDPRMAGIQLGLDALGREEDYIQQEVGSLNAQAQARGVQPSPAQMQMAVQNARAKYRADQMELAKLAISQDRPDPYAGMTLPPGR